MANAAFTESSFLGGEWSPNALGRIENPAYRTSLATSLNGLPLEEGAWTRRSGTRDVGELGSNGQLVTFYLPNNNAVLLELTASTLGFWVMDTTVTYRRLAQTFSTPWPNAELCQNVRVVAANGTAFFLDGTNLPHVLVCTNFLTASLSVDPTFTFTSADFTTTDGPYLDPLPGQSQTGNSPGSVSSFTASTTFTITDGAYSFVSTDLNRAIRIWSQPPAWSTVTTYNEGDVVTFEGEFWSCLVGGSLNLGIQPGSVTQPASDSTSVPTQAWALAPQQGVWAFGSITEVINTSQAQIDLHGPQINENNGMVIDTWQLGLYTKTTWPSCGCYHEGRLWFGGAVPDRIDACVSNGIGANPPNPTPLFSPTDRFGNVLDDSGIAAPLNLSPDSSALWLMPDLNGILIGTASGEQLCTASALGDPLTPTSIQIRKQTEYKAHKAEPVRMGIAIGFVQAFGRRVMEYVADVFSQRFIGRHLNEFAKHLTTSGVFRIAYQEELAPVLWCVNGFGHLLGCTYRRISHFGTEGPVFNGWHQHLLGSGRSVNWASMATTADGHEDVLALITKDPSGQAHLEIMRRLFDVGDPITSGWFLDSAQAATQIVVNDNGSGLYIGGLQANAGTLMTVSILGLDCGDFTPTPEGFIFVPYGSDPDGIFTQAYLTSRSSNQYGDAGVSFTLTTGTAVTVPIIVGYTFTSTAKLPRPATVEDVRTQTGPGMAKTRRIHQYGLQVANSITGALVSVDAGPTHPALFVELDQITQLNHNTLYSGVFWDTVDDDNSFDGQLTISQSRPYPLTLANVTGFINTEDR